MALDERRGSLRAMRITKVQQGLIAQQEFAKLVMMGSRGRIELAPPLTDDERRDFEVHIRGQYGFGLAIQVKSTMYLRKVQRGQAHYLTTYFPVRATRLVNNPLYWYFLGYLDPKLMRFADPVFLIPSRVLHEHAAPERHGAFWTFMLMASMEAKTRDKWHPYRVNTLDLGEKMLEIMADLRRRPKLAPPSAAVMSLLGSVRVQLAKD